MTYLTHRIAVLLLIALLGLAVPAWAQDADDVTLEDYVTEDGFITTLVPTEWEPLYQDGGSVLMRNTDTIDFDANFPAAAPGEYGIQVLPFPADFLSFLVEEGDPDATALVTSLTADADPDASFGEVQTIEMEDGRDVALVEIDYESGGGVIIAEVTDAGAVLVFAITDPSEFAFVTALSMRILEGTRVDFDVMLEGLGADDTETEAEAMPQEMIEGFPVSPAQAEIVGEARLEMQAPIGWERDIDLAEGTVLLRSNADLVPTLADIELGPDDYLISMTIIPQAPDQAPDIIGSLGRLVLQFGDELTAGEPEAAAGDTIVFSTIETATVAGAFAYEILPDDTLIQARAYAAPGNGETVSDLLLGILQTIVYEDLSE